MREERKKQTRAWLLLLTLGGGIFLTGGCRKRQNNSGANVAVRLINAVPDAAALTVAVNGRAVWRRSPYRNNTGFQEISEGNYDVEVRIPNASAPLAQASGLTLKKERAYTVLALGTVYDTSVPTKLRVFEDARGESVTPGKARVRLVNAAASAGSVDLLVNNIVGLKRVAYGERSDALLLGGATYDLKIINAAGGNVTPLVGPLSLRLTPGKSYTLVVMGGKDAGNLTLEAYPDAP